MSGVSFSCLSPKPQLWRNVGIAPITLDARQRRLCGGTVTCRRGAHPSGVVVASASQNLVADTAVVEHRRRELIDGLSEAEVVESVDIVWDEAAKRVESEIRHCPLRRLDICCSWNERADRGWGVIGSVEESDLLRAVWVSGAAYRREVPKRTLLVAEKRCDCTYFGNNTFTRAHFARCGFHDAVRKVWERKVVGSGGAVFSFSFFVVGLPFFFLPCESAVRGPCSFVLVRVGVAVQRRLEI